MHFTVDKPRFQQMLRIAQAWRTSRKRDDHHSGPFMRIEASDGRLRLTTRLAEAEYSFEAFARQAGAIYEGLASPASRARSS